MIFIFYFDACVPSSSYACMLYPCMHNTEEIIEKYVIDANLFRQLFTNPKKNPASIFFFSKNVQYIKINIPHFFYKVFKFT